MISDEMSRAVGRIIVSIYAYLEFKVLYDVTALSVP